MRILIACETSGEGRRAWQAAGHDAWSCDLLPSEDDSPNHIIGDAIEIMRGDEFDAYGLHPPCTYLSVSSIHWNNRGRGWEKTELAVRFALDLIDIAGNKPYYLENPVSILSTRWRKPDQIIQPYQFGHDASKKTCLWLQHWTRLRLGQRFNGRLVEWPLGSGRIVERWSNQTDSGQNKLPPTNDRWKLRSRSYPNIMQAMAKQWGSEKPLRTLFPISSHLAEKNQQ